MTSEEFIKKWRDAPLTERAAAHSHFLDLCEVLDEPAPNDADPSGDGYAFERGATKTTGRKGWADVRKRGMLRLGVQEPGRPAGPDQALCPCPSTPVREVFALRRRVGG